MTGPRKKGCQPAIPWPLPERYRDALRSAGEYALAMRKKHGDESEEYADARAILDRMNLNIHVALSSQEKAND